MIETTVYSPQEQVALDYLARQVLEAFLVDKVMPLRANEVRDRLAELALSSGEIRAFMLNQPNKFVQEERRWLPLYRKSPLRLPTLAYIEEIVRAIGAPVAQAYVAEELAARYRRSEEYFETILPRLCQHAERLFITPSHFVGLREWLFRPEWIEPIPYEWEQESERERAVHDALFYNDLSWEQIEPYLKHAQKLDWSQPESAVKLLERVGKPLPNRLIGFFGWYLTLDPDPRWVFPYDPIALFDAVLTSGKFVWGSDGQWYPAETAETWLQQARGILKQWLQMLPAEETQPLELRPDEVEQIVEYVLSRPGVARASVLLEEMFEVSPKSRTFREDLDTLINALWSDGRVAWFGFDRFGRDSDVPEYVHSVPSVFEFPEPKFITNPESEVGDVLIDPEGYPRPLRDEVKDPRAQDVLDEETPAYPPTIPSKVRIVLRLPHKDLGTIPLCQVPLGFFQDEPPIQQLTFIDEKGQTFEVWLNHHTRLIYGLFDKFASLEVLSGAIFELEQTDQPDTFYFRYTGETDPLLAISPSRYERLLDLQARADDLSTYHLLVELMRDHPRGADYLTLHNELNIIRRTRRELTASVLSAYPCFELHKGSPVWHLNESDIGKPITKKARTHLLE